MKVTVENIKGLNKDIKVFIDKKTMSNYMDEKYEEIKSTVNLKGFRPGKVPKEILKRQDSKIKITDLSYVLNNEYKYENINVNNNKIDNVNNNKIDNVNNNKIDYIYKSLNIILENQKKIMIDLISILNNKSFTKIYVKHSVLIFLIKFYIQE